MRRVTQGLVVLLAGTGAATADDVGGTYAVSGTNLDGSPYSGTALIEATSDSTCTIDWTIGETASSGICMLAGDAFAVGYSLGEAVGLGIYVIADDGTLEGFWTVAGQSGRGTEVLTPQ